MKITSVDVIEVFVPHIEPIRKVGWADRPHTIVNVHTLDEKAVAKYRTK